MFDDYRDNTVNRNKVGQDNRDIKFSYPPSHTQEYVSVIKVSCAGIDKELNDCPESYTIHLYVGQFHKVFHVNPGKFQPCKRVEKEPVWFHSQEVT